MHIPDGYLSPVTCAALYGASAPFWWVSLRRVQRRLTTRLLPLLSLFSAFSFVIMLFNLPLPGGTSGHAVGVAVATIVLGPWASMLAVSVALLIQAVFFGDGGITALGANCFNMAIVGSLVAYAVYGMIAGRASLTSRRRVIAAGVAGYVAINVAALLAAIEFGIQPIYFHDAAGAPLYAPYPLKLAIPAMMIGHLTVAGMAELVLSAGLVAYLQRADATLLRATAPETSAVLDDRRVPGRATLWAGLALLLLLTPLGVLTVGKAWGEWSAGDFKNPAARRQIENSTGRQSLPPQVPAGLERLSSFWTAPFPDYAPPVVRHRAFGYLLSAMFGAGLIVAALGLFAHFTARGSQPETAAPERLGAG